MGRVESKRKLAEALFKTLRRLEADPTVDQQDPAFVQLKCNLIQRLVSVQVDSAEMQAQIHLVDSPELEASASPDVADDAAIA